ncbi:MAG: hypothetical protein M1828_003820 [Chrysothrix sp. TS-e1954]|nr:MAG: hypothetical protein M1828_003820 [Chrysothrix sp. TS-e1954]
MALTKGSTCYCGDLLPSESDQTDSSACSTPCFGFGQQSCGGDSAFNVYLTGTQATVGSVGSDGSDSDSSSSSAPPPSSSTPIESTSYSSAPQSVYTPPSTSSTTSTTSTSTSVSATTKIKSTVVSASPSYITLGGSTIVRTVGSEPTSNDSQSSPSASSSSSSSGLSTGGKVGIAIGVIGGVIALAAIIGAVVVYLKRNNKDGVTGRHRRNTSTNGFVASGVAPAGSIASDNRLDTTMVENRRRSGESVFADNEDYSRRILKVVNNPGED